MNQLIHQKRIIQFLVLVLISSFGTSDTLAQNTLKGKVEYTQVNEKITISRGSNYRNRGKDKNSDKAKASETKAMHSIISLKPLKKTISVVKRNGTLIQKDKTFEPHVLAITAGSTVSFTNQDEFFHNVFSLSKGNRFNIGRKKPKVSVKKTFDKPGIIKVFCDIHPQMNAIILCLETPYYSDVDEEGNYQIENVPNGTYTLSFYNPSVQMQDQTIDLTNGKVTIKDFIITPDKSTSSVDLDTHKIMAPCCAGTMCSHTTAE